MAADDTGTATVSNVEEYSDNRAIQNHPDLETSDEGGANGSLDNIGSTAADGTPSVYEHFMGHSEHGRCQEKLFFGSKGLISNDLSEEGGQSEPVDESNENEVPDDGLQTSSFQNNQPSTNQDQLWDSLTVLPI